MLLFWSAAGSSRLLNPSIFLEASILSSVLQMPFYSLPFCRSVSITGCVSLCVYLSNLLCLWTWLETACFGSFSRNSSKEDTAVILVVESGCCPIGATDQGHHPIPPRATPFHPTQSHEPSSDDIFIVTSLTSAAFLIAVVDTAMELMLGEARDET